MAATKKDSKPTAAPVKYKTPRYGKVAVQEHYDPEDDYQVPHSGTVDEETGRPRYDESPVPGHHIISWNRKNPEHINARGQEIDEDTGEVLDPERYKDDVNELG